MGKLVMQFETDLAEFVGARHAVFVNSGTAALHLACEALGIGHGDEVICPALTFVATSNAVLYAGATPVFADITSITDLNISPAQIEKKISPRTKAIMVVHYAGYPCAMMEIKKIAQKHNLSVIEDATHALGSEFEGVKCGLASDAGIFSFFSNKNMTTGEGGMLVSNNAALIKKARLLRSHAMSRTTWDRFKGQGNSYDVLDLGYNYRPGEINAALGIVQLNKIMRNNAKRKKLTLSYRKLLKSVKGCILPFLDNKEISAYHIFPLVLSEFVNRNQLIDRLRKKGIQTSMHYPPIHQFTYYRKLFKKKIHLPHTEYIGKQEITLPLHPQMKESQLDYVAESLKKEIGYCVK